ncbi:hypothetical protein ACRRQU_004691 [Salmonella enterica subsp. enterica]|nr:hypothetical protein [Salmonella enterica subsp. enterica]EDQ4488617.1 hypothetical protein [Salmonella enterica subsp. enterica serovar Java]EEA7585156.1 hypothetical protein [Salmonella enterica]
MKEVKIYTIVSDQLSPPITEESFCTDMVRHSDYADLEEKCAALAAENAGLKHAMAVTLEHVSVTDAGQAGVAAMIINDALHHGETPATDAFLAEVRASAIEAFADNQEKIADEELVGGNLDLSLRFRGMARAAKEFSAQIRQEAAQ